MGPLVQQQFSYLDGTASNIQAPLNAITSTSVNLDSTVRKYVTPSSITSTGVWIKLGIFQNLTTVDDYSLIELISVDGNAVDSSSHENYHLKICCMSSIGSSVPSTNGGGCAVPAKSATC